MVNARHYLQQVKKFDLLIQNKIEEAKKWQDIAENITASSDITGIHSGNTSDKVGNAVVNYVTLQEAIKADISEFYDLRNKIIKDIEKLPTSEYLVLYGIYVECVDYYTIAERANRSMRWLNRRHSNGLKMIQEILDERNKENEKDTDGSY